MPADVTWVAGDSGPAFLDTLTFSDGTPAPLEGYQSLTLVMRSLTSPQPLTLTGTATVTNYFDGGVEFSPSTADTQNTPGDYMGNWVVVYSTGQQQTFPTEGYLWIRITPGLSNESRQLVSLPYVKDYLSSFGNSTERVHDTKLLHFIEAATPLIENIVGPVLVQQFEEWHEGGQYWIQLRRRPSTAKGTSPILILQGIDEYRGPIKYPLQVITDPTQAGIYSVMLDSQIGTVVRRTTGGGVIPFGAGFWGGGMPQGVHVVYSSGQQTVPANVQEATAEAVRVNYEQTMAAGRGSWTRSDDFDSGPPLGFYLPRRCLDLLAPMRRHPAMA